jgi:UBX domain-containing protein 1/4
MTLSAFTVQGALEWLEENQDKSLEEIKAAGSITMEKQEGFSTQAPEQPQSLVCNDCGKKFRTQEQAEYHASKTQHIDFSESTDEISPLGEEEKKAKLAELKERLAAKRALESEQDKIDRKKNEVCPQTCLSGRFLHMARKFVARTRRMSRISRRSSRRRSR